MFFFTESGSGSESTNLETHQGRFERNWKCNPLLQRKPFYFVINFIVMCLLKYFWKNEKKKNEDFDSKNVLSTFLNYVTHQCCMKTLVVLAVLVLVSIWNNIFLFRNQSYTRKDVLIKLVLNSLTVQNFC